jgi:hypothetical protein
MSVSELIGLISGLLQFAVACYAVRVSRRFGVAKVGWPFFAAFSLLAVAHVLQTFHPLDLEFGFGISTNVFYEVISVLLLASLAQTELLVWKRHSHRRPVIKETVIKETDSTASARIAAEIQTWSKANAELQETVGKLRAEAAQHIDALEQAKAAFQNQLVASQQQFEDAKALAAASQEQLAAAQEQLSACQEQLAASHQRLSACEEQLTASQKQLLTSHEQLALSQTQLKEVQEQLAALSHSERELQRHLTLAQAELAQQKELLQRAKDAFQEAQNKLESAHQKKLEELEQTHWHQLMAGRQSEETLRRSVAGLEAAVAEQKRNFEQEKKKHEKSEKTCRELLVILRQSGLTEVATLSQSKVAHLSRIAKAIRDHKKSLGRFIKSDPQGKQLPESLSVIVDYLSDEQFLLQKKLGSVKKKIEELESTLNLEAKTSATAAVLSAENSETLQPHLSGEVTSTGTEPAGEATPPKTPATAASKAKKKVASRA